MEVNIFNSPEGATSAVCVENVPLMAQRLFLSVCFVYDYYHCRCAVLFFLHVLVQSSQWHKIEEPSL